MFPSILVWPLFLLPFIVAEKMKRDFLFESSECDIGGTWSTWLLSPIQTGYDYCGSSWKANYVRRCLSEPGCPCNGTTMFTGEINTGPCYSPRIPCAPGYRLKVIDGEFVCANTTTESVAKPPIDETPLPNDTYCPPSGVGIWGHWSEWEKGCSATCGQFGTKKRTRNCTSEAYGCPCFASDWGPCQMAPCPETPCPKAPVCKGPLVSSYEHKMKYCYPFKATPPVGSWTKWVPASGAACNDTCGMFGWVDSRRYCLPPGSVCEGSEYWSMQPCPETPVCFPPKKSACIEGYRRTITNGTFVCIKIT